MLLSLGGVPCDRLLAIARHLPDPVLVTSSATLPAGDLLVEHLPDTSPRFLRDRLRHLISLHDARVVVLDGVPEDGVLAATADHPSVSWVWLRPAMWPRGAGSPWRGREAAFDLVLTPGEFAAAADEGWTALDRTEVETVPPITLLDRTELLDRTAARTLLGLDESPTVLLRGARVPVPGFTEISPPPHAVRAADLAVATADYTSFHALLSAGVPTVFVPDESATDDQVARARFAAAAGVALCAEPGGDLPLTVAADPSVREALAARCAEVAFGNGAAQTAARITALVGRPS